MWSLAFLTSALAHPISLTSGRAVIHSNRVDLLVDVMVEDFVLFHGLSPNEQDLLTPAEIEKGIEKHKPLLVRDLMVRDEQGERIEGRLDAVERGEIPSAGLKMDALMKHTVRYRLMYPLAEPPTFLSFNHTLGGTNAPVPGVLELNVRQAGLNTDETVMLPRGSSPEVYEFDWEARDLPGESAEDAWVRRREVQKQKRMGITSYDAIYGFIYILNDEVRIELLVPLVTLETWIGVDRASPDFIEVAEQAAARESLAEFFTGKNVVKIDGLPVKPTLERLDFYGLSFRDFAVRPEPRRLSALTARVGAILSYSAKQPPTELDITWEYFNAAVFVARTSLYAYDHTVEHSFSRYRPTFSWRALDERVRPEIKAQGVRLWGVSANDAGQVAERLLANVYRAFDYRDESDIYDALAHSVAGELLADLYLKINRGLQMQEQGGAVARVKEVKVEESTVRKHLGRRKGFTVGMTWTVEGTVEHWGHIHTRINRYHADFDVRPVEGAWKIMGMQVTDQERVKYQVKLREL